MKRSSILLYLACCVSFMGNGLIKAQSVDIEGELRRWHNVTFTFDGPNSSETANPNPFTDYRMEVVFTHSATRTSYRIPGYFAACGNAANNSCTSGNKWRVHFAPDRPGQWDWQAVLVTGNDIAIKTGGQSAGFFDGRSGSITVQESNKSGRDHRAANRGRLQYVNTHYLRYSGTTPDQPNGPWFLKAGADAPENTLNYEDFDATPANRFTPKTWQPHQQDYRANDAKAYTWANGKGTELLGVIRYLSVVKEVNAISFLTFSLDGDDKSVFPHLIKPNEAGKNWGQVYHDRFDVSKMAQWEQIFAYADKKGVFLHFKTQETENDQKMDGGAVGRERKLYYRELIARFGHHLALNWNLGEENTQNTSQRKAMAQYFADHDPYQHHVVIHSYPNQKDQIYDPMLGNKSELTGASLQSGITSVHDDVVEWRERSANAGRPWVIANDEQGNASIGIDVDPKDNEKVRKEVIWGTLLGGGCGFEYYYGYQTGSSDLTSQDHRTRDAKYDDAAHALAFFNDYVQAYLPDVVSKDNESSQRDDYLLRTADKQAYIIYLPEGGRTEIQQLPNQGYDYRWYNPRTGQMGSKQSLTGNQLQAPNSQDWVALVESNGAAPSPNPTPTPTPPTTWTFEEINGRVAFEAEHFNQQTLHDDRAWYETSTSTTPNVKPDPDPNHASSASGDAYIEILPDTRVTHSDPLVNGVSFSNTPGKVAILNYEVYFNNPGRYFVWVRAYSTGTEDNGVHVGLDGQWPASGQRMQWCTGKNNWTWESKQRTNANHCGEARKIYLDIPSKGLHTISFSMREDGFEMDKMVLSKAYNKPSGDGPAEVLYGGSTGTPPSPPTPNTCVNPLPAQSVNKTNPGLWTNIYKLNSLKRLPDFNNLTADQQVVVPMVEIPNAAGKTGYAALYEGWIDIPDEDEYTFYLKSDDGSMLLIDGQTIIDNDGLHGCREKSGSVCLASGMHAIRIAFFQAQGGQCLELAFENPSLNKQAIPASIFSHTPPQTPLPAPTPTACEQGTFGNNGKPWLPNQAIQAENFDVCTNDFNAAGTTYFEKDKNKQGNPSLRPNTLVDLDKFNGNGQYVTWIRQGEFWEYTLETPKDEYTITVNLATLEKSTKKLEVLVDGQSIDTLEFSRTKGWTRFEAYTTRPFGLSAGKHIVRLKALSSTFNIDWLQLNTYQGGGNPTNPGSPQTFQTSFSVIEDAYLQGTKRYDNTLIRIEKDKRTAYLKFDLTNFTGNITGARLHLQVYSDPGNGTIQIRKGESHNWTEQNLSSANAPQPGVVLATQNGTFSLGNTYTFELDPQLIQNRAYLSLVMNHLGGNDVAFASDESGQFVPKLEIDYTANARLSDQMLDVEVYPNPFDQIFTISVGEQHGLNEILLVDMTGRVIQQWYLAPDQSQLKVQVTQDIPSGVYTLQLRGNTHRQFVWILKE